MKMNIQTEDIGLNASLRALAISDYSEDPSVGPGNIFHPILRSAEGSQLLVLELAQIQKTSPRFTGGMLTN
jgi:hypothetical protein